MTAKKILIVDDCPINRAILEELLSGDFETTSAESGEEAKPLALEFKPNLVLLDVMMPGLNGYEICRWIRSLPELKATKIFMLSALAAPAEIERGLAVGADKYVTKPFDVWLLRNAIREQLAVVSSAL